MLAINTAKGFLPRVERGVGMTIIGQSVTTHLEAVVFFYIVSKINIY